MQLSADDLDADQGGSPSVWPSYVAAVASVVLCVLLLISVLAVVVNQFSVFAKRAVDQAAQAERPSPYRLNEFDPVVSESLLASADGVDDGRTEDGLLSAAKEVDQLKEKLNGLLKANGEAKARAADKPEVIGVDSRVQIVVAERPLAQDAVRVNIRWVFAFESGAFDLDPSAVVMLRDLAKEHAGNKGVRWTLDAGVAGLNDVAIREVFELANQVRARLIDFGVSQTLIDFKLHKSQTQTQLALDDSAADRADLLIVLQVRDGRSTR